MAEMVSLVAYVTARPGKEEETKAMLLSLVAPTREEPGCIDYHLLQSEEDPCAFVFYENWHTRKDLDEHLAKPHLQAFIERQDELLAKAVVIDFYTMLSPRDG